MAVLHYWRAKDRRLLLVMIGVVTAVAMSTLYVINLHRKARKPALRRRDVTNYDECAILTSSQHSISPPPAWKKSSKERVRRRDRKVKPPVVGSKDICCPPLPVKVSRRSRSAAMKTPIIGAKATVKEQSSSTKSRSSRGPKASAKSYVKRMASRSKPEPHYKPAPRTWSNMTSPFISTSTTKSLQTKEPCDDSKKAANLQPLMQ